MHDSYLCPPCNVLGLCGHVTSQQARVLRNELAQLQGGRVQRRNRLGSSACTPGKRHCTVIQHVQRLAVAGEWQGISEREETLRVAPGRVGRQPKWAAPANPVEVDAHEERTDKAPSQQDADESWGEPGGSQEQRKVTVPGTERERYTDAGNEQHEHGDAPERGDGAQGCRSSERAESARVRRGVAARLPHRLCHRCDRVVAISNRLAQLGDGDEQVGPRIPPQGDPSESCAERTDANERRPIRGPVALMPDNHEGHGIKYQGACVQTAEEAQYPELHRAQAVLCPGERAVRTRNQVWHRTEITHKFVYLRMNQADRQSISSLVNSG